MMLVVSQLSGMTFGLMLSMICNTRDQVVPAGMGAFFVTLLTSGVLWPIEGMPSGIKEISMGLPLTLSCKVAQDSLFRLPSYLFNLTSILGFTIPIIWTGVFLCLCIFLGRPRVAVHFLFLPW